MITLATLPDATAQEVFEQVANHLLDQGERSEENESCKYRYTKANGRVLSCAAGCLMSDEEYSESYEKREWDTLVYNRRVPRSHDSLIRNLQQIHDGVEVSQWKIGLINLAKSFDLDASFLERRTA